MEPFEQKVLGSRQRQLSIKQREWSLPWGGLGVTAQKPTRTATLPHAVGSRGWKWTELGSGLLDWPKPPDFIISSDTDPGMMDFVTWGRL